jgi:hypothetical protein
VDPLTRTFRRIVTGHDKEGSAVIASDAPPTRVHQVGGPGGATFFEVWNTRESPAAVDRDAEEPIETALVLAPPKGGTRIRVIDFPPESDEIRQMGEAQARAEFSAMGDAGASRSGAGARHPLMHRTETIDYGIMLEGELTLIVDRGETTIRAGDIVVQRGTSHAWANRSASICRVAFVLVDGRFVDGL